MASGEMTVGQFTHFLTTFMYLSARHSENGSLHYLCIDWRHLLELLTAGNQVYSKRHIVDQPLTGSAESAFDRPEDLNVMESIKRRILAAAREEQELTAVAPPTPSPEEPTPMPEESE